jgi:hypothetical protein
MTDNDVEIGRLVGQALKQGMQSNFDRLESTLSRLLERQPPPTHNGNGTPMVVNTGGGQPTFHFDYRAFGEALAAALTPTFNQQIAYNEKLETLIEQVSQLAQAIAGMEIRPTINVPQAAVSVELPPARGSFKVEHDDGTVSRVTMEG